MEPAERPWTATYRLQMNASFTFDDVAEVVPYLAELGISHVYFSPVLQATPGSPHGYDVTDPSRISDDLGGSEAYERACEALADHGIGQMWDIVPNHMAASESNPWWRDVLRLGQASPYARYFDLRWQEDPQRGAYIRLPVLGSELNKTIEAGEIRLAVEDGETLVRYYGQSFPLSPETVPEDGIEPFSLDPGLLYDLLQRQHYHLVHWRSASEAADYRRFFDINGLVGFRVEEPPAFDAAHQLTLDLASKRQIQGLRVDHIDGLRDPYEYLARLRNGAPDARILVEKILEGDESLNQRWPIDGTTGYDFLATVNSLFVDSAAEATLTNLFEELTGEHASYESLLEEKKRQALTDLLHADIAHLAERFEAACPDVQIDRDYLEATLREIIVSLPVYRTYLQPERGEIEESDRQNIGTGLNGALSRLPGAPLALVRALRSLFQLERNTAAAAEFVLAFQQVSGPAMAKGAEDTAFYSANRLVSLNEVGGNPSRFGLSPATFHRLAASYADRWPGTMLSTATHDTKRGEDIRLRISALSETPLEWSMLIRGWMQNHAEFKTGNAPDDNTRYLLYQTLAGAWPITAERIKEYMLKAVREAKTYTSWTAQNAGYEAALLDYIDDVIANGAFVEQCAAYASRLDEIAHVSSLAQTMLKLTAPGIPDFYQGTELWDLNLVDPDNRRLVDFERRRNLLQKARTAHLTEVMEHKDEGLPKLWLIWKVLQLRNDFPELFRGVYAPVYAAGPNAECVVAFTRGGRMMTIVPRLPQRLSDNDETTVAVPLGKWRNAFTNKRVPSGELPVKVLLTEFPVALLIREMT